MDDLLREFIAETGESLELVDRELVRLEQSDSNGAILDHIFRLVHTIKGACGFLGLYRLEALTHAAEGLMDRLRDGLPLSPDTVTLILDTIDVIKQVLAGLERHGFEPDGSDAPLIARLAEAAGGNEAALAQHEVDALMRGEGQALLARAAAAPIAEAAEPRPDPAIVAAQPGRVPNSVRVSVQALDALMTVASELVLTRNQLTEIVRGRSEPELEKPLQRLSQVAAELHVGVMQARMQPISRAWQQLPRLVRALGNQLGKSIELELTGGDTELDRQVLERIKESLTHLVRNAADHGIESAAQRRAAGKSERGTIRLSARHESGHIVVEVADDGSGLDLARIRSKTLERGLYPPAEIEKLSAAQLQRCIFAPGFSTADATTNISGRGVGLDVVKHGVEQIGGTIDVASVPGGGASFTLRIPLTLAITSALIVAAADRQFAVPQIAVSELIAPRADAEQAIETLQGMPFLRTPKRLIPLVSLRTMLQLGEPEDAAPALIVVMQAGATEFGLIVDRAIGTEEVVVKPLCAALAGLQVYSGATVLGDGTIITILNPAGIVTHCRIEGTSSTAAARDEAEPESAQAQSMLVFEAGGRRQAVPVEDVDRIEGIATPRIERSGRTTMIAQAGRLLPLVNPDALPDAPGEVLVLIVTRYGASAAMVIDAVIDIVREEVSLQVPGRGDILGTAMLAGVATEIVDLDRCIGRLFRTDNRRAATAPAAAEHGKRALLLEASPFFRDMLTATLSAAGFAAVATASPEQALAALAEGRWSAAIVDLTGAASVNHALPHAMRAAARDDALPVLGLVALPDAALRLEAQRNGYSGVFGKFDRAALVRALQPARGALAEAA